MPMPNEERYTLAYILAGTEDEREELIEGKPMMMAPPTRIHQEITGAIYRQIGNYLEGKRCKVYQAPFGVRLFEKDGDAPEDVDTLVEPDIAVVCDMDKLDRLGCKGAPDLIVEVLSPSTQRHDRLTKFNLYQKAGVREYWLADPENQTIQSFMLQDGHYTATGFAGMQDVLKVNVLEGCFVELSRVFPEK